MFRWDVFRALVAPAIVFSSALGAASALADTPSPAAAASAAPAAAATPFVDTICPGTTSDVQKYQAMVANPDTLVDDAIAAAKATADQYQACASSKRGSTQLEAKNYATMRTAQFLIATGHWQRLIYQNEPARMQFQTALKMLAVVIDWHSATDSAPSQYHDEATRIRDAGAGELALLSKTTASPAPAASPAH